MKKPNSGKVREKAERLMKERTTRSDYSLTESEAIKLIHSLEVHQIELELQNEELGLARSEAKKNAQKYTDLYDFAPNGYFTLSTEGEILELNLNGAKMLGKERLHLINSLFGFFVSASNKLIFQNFLEKVFKSERKESCEILLSTNGGSEEYFYLTGIVNGKRDNCFVTALNITERKLAERDLAKSTKRFESLVELLPEAVFEFDVNFKITYVNQRAIELFAYSQDDISSGLNALEMIVPEQRELAKSIFAKRFKGEEPGRIEYLAIKKDGSTFPILYHANSIIEAGKLIGARGVIVDISELEKIKLDLQNSEEKFKNIFNNSVVGKSITTLEGGMQVNKAFSQIIGYSEEELNQMNWKEFTHAEDINSNLEIINSIISGKMQTAQWEKRYIHKNGSIVWVDISTTLQRDEKSKPQFFITTIVDITERKKTEKNLKEYKELFSLFMHYSPVYTFIKEVTPTQSRVLQASDNFKEMIGISGKDMVGKTMEELFPPEFAAKLTADDWNVIKEDKVLQLDENLNDKHYTTIKFPINRGDKKLLAGYTIDITERKKYEKELLRSQELLNQTGRMAKVGGWELDVLTMSSYFTDETFHLHELPVGEVPGVKGGIKFYAPEAQAKIKKAVEDAIEKNIPYDIEVPFITAKGNNIWVRTHCETELKDGKVVRLFGSIQDITERKKNEIDLTKAKEKAEESDRLKSAFLANMSHEIRTPMNGILGFSDLLKQPNLTGEQQQQYVGIIEKSGERMLSTINDIIDISKIEAGQVDVLISEINIGEQLDSLNSFFKPEADKKGIQLLLENQFVGQDTIIKSDRNKLNSILINLLKNALKFCDKGSIEFGCVLKGKILEFFVKDTGKGIPQARQQAIFDRFVQADIEDVEAKQGSGLGLTISKSYVEILGGKIWLESEEGKGSIFFFEIPHIKVKEEKSEFKRIPNEITDEKLNLKILIVEDDPVSEMLAQIMLGELCKELVTATNGTDAIRICQDKPGINLILMDIKMPGIDGYETTRKIREFNKEAVIIAQTAFALAGDREKALEAGCNDYIPKPINRATLLKMIKEHLNPGNA